MNPPGRPRRVRFGRNQGQAGSSGQKRHNAHHICHGLIALSNARRHQKNLWATADKLRANMDAAEYKHLVLGLIFLKYVSDTFTARRAEIDAPAARPRRRVLLCPRQP